MTGTFSGGRVLGSPIRVSPSWFIALAFSTALLGLRVIPDTLPSYSSVLHWTLALATSLTFFLSILLHELGLAIVAQRFGIRVRSITLFLLGGVAQIAQEVKKPGAEILIAGAGPFVSLFLALVFFLCARATGGRREPVEVMFTWLWVTNLSVGVFNLVPGFPMDGGRVFRALLWAATGNYRWASRIAGWTGRAVAGSLLLLGLAMTLGIGGFALRGDSFSGLWLVLVALYLDNAARGSLESLRLLEHLRRFRAGDVMLHDVPIVRSGAMVGDFLPDMLAQRDCDAAFVAEYANADDDTDGGRMIGLVTRGSAITVPEWKRTLVTALELMLPADEMEPAAPDEDAASLLQRLEGEGLVAVPVVSGGEVLGLVGRTNLLKLIERRGRH
jgi:Zn-dependent protease